MEDKNGRLLALFDAAIAITITLLMLEIRLPAEASELTDGELLSALGDIWPRYLGYVISFLVIASFWISHRQKFQYIVKSSSVLLWLNIVFLMLVGIVPFASSLISNNPGATSTIFYAGIMLAASLTLSLIWLYARRAGLVDSNAPAGFDRSQLLRGVGVALVFLLSIAIAPVSSDAAKFSWLLILPVQFFASRSRRSPSKRATPDPTNLNS